MNKASSFAITAFQLLLVFLLPLPELSAQTIIVGPGLEVDNIKYGMALAEDGDTILVKDGVYLQEISVFKSVVLRAENRYKAVIGDGSSTKARIQINREQTDSVVIEGFKFAPGNYPGIWVGGPSTEQSPTYCTIRNNLIEGRKDGIVVLKTAATSDTSMVDLLRVFCTTNRHRPSGRGSLPLLDSIHFVGIG